jgi:hypothetical protein
MVSVFSLKQRDMLEEKIYLYAIPATIIHFTREGFFFKVDSCSVGEVSLILLLLWNQKVNDIH